MNNTVIQLVVASGVSAIATAFLVRGACFKMADKQANKQEAQCVESMATCEEVFNDSTRINTLLNESMRAQLERCRKQLVTARTQQEEAMAEAVVCIAALSVFVGVITYKHYNTKECSK